MNFCSNVQQNSAGVPPIKTWEINTVCRMNIFHPEKNNNLNTHTLLFKLVLMCVCKNNEVACKLYVGKLPVFVKSIQILSDVTFHCILMILKVDFVPRT